MMTKQDRQTLVDISTVIQMMSKTMQQQISPSFVEFIEKNKDNNYTSYINKTVPLREQQLTENTKTILALIYRDYLCSPSMRKDLILKEHEEIKKIENEKREKYKIEFKNNKNIQTTANQNTSLVVYKKKNIFKKIYNKIKKLLNFN